MKKYNSNRPRNNFGNASNKWHGKQKTRTEYQLFEADNDLPTYYRNRKLMQEFIAECDMYAYTVACVVTQRRYGGIYGNRPRRANQYRNINRTRGE